MIRLNAREEEIMNIFWRLKKAFPKEIMVNVQEPIPPYNTVLSIIRKLEKDGFIAHTKIGKSHQYYPTMTKRAYQKSILTHLVKSYFGGSPEKLLSFFMKEEKMDAEQVQSLLDQFQNEEE